MGRRRKYSPRTFEKACEAYFRRRAYEVPVQRLVPNGRTNAKGLPVMEFEDVTNADGETIFVTEYSSPPSVESLCLELGITRATFANYANDERYFEICDGVKLRIEEYLHRQLNRRERGLEGLIFDLKVNHGWREGKENSGAPSVNVTGDAAEEYSE